MHGNLEVYDLYLEVQGPVFVGSGQMISKKEYIFLPNQKVGIIDMEKLYGFLRRKRLDGRYEEYLFGNGFEDLKQWLGKYGITEKEIQPYMKYIIGNDGADMQRNRQLQVASFIKDPYGKPYVPGSSIKGMIRTMLLGAELSSNPQKYRAQIREIQQTVERERKLRTVKVARKIESAHFNQLDRKPNRREDAVNDFMAGLIVSDSDPLEVSDLNLCPKLDMHTDGKMSKLPLLRECLKPGTKIHCTVTVDRGIMERAGVRWTQYTLFDAARTFTDSYNQEFAGKFGRKFLLDEDNVLLGGGIGYVSKTVIYSMIPGQEGLRTVKTILDKTVPKHSSIKDRGVSPRVLKTTFCQGRAYQMGVCRFELKKR